MSTNVVLTEDSAWQYIPGLAGNAIIASIYGLFFMTTFYHWYRTAKGARFGLCLPIGLNVAAVGFGMRVIATRSQSAFDSIPLYTTMNLFVVLSPATFLAFNYIVFGRMIVAIDPTVDEHAKRTTKSRYSFIPPKIVGRLFVWSDVTTFIIQATGGGLQAAGGSSANLGDMIFLVGVTLQAISYALFIVLVTFAHVKLRHESSQFSLSYIFSSHPIIRLFVLLYFSSIFIMVRSVYRIIEMAQGYSGMLASKEAYLLALDAAPLILATVVWAVQWPAAILERAAEERGFGEEAGGNNVSIERFPPAYPAKSEVAPIRTPDSIEKN